MNIKVKLLRAAAVEGALRDSGAIPLCYNIYTDSAGLHISSSGIDWLLPGGNSLEMAASLVPCSTHSFDKVVLGYFIAAGIIEFDGLFG